MKKFRKVLSIVLAVLMPADEPLVEAGSTTPFALTYPAA